MSLKFETYSRFQLDILVFSINTSHCQRHKISFDPNNSITFFTYVLIQQPKCQLQGMQYNNAMSRNMNSNRTDLITHKCQCSLRAAFLCVTRLRFQKLDSASVITEKGQKILSAETVSILKTGSARGAN